MSRTFLWAMVFIAGAAALVLLLFPPKSTVGFSASDNKQMNDFIDRFDKLLSDDGGKDNLLPASEMTADDIKWLYDQDRDSHIKAAKGLRLANGDLLYIFCTDTDEYMAKNMKEGVDKPGYGCFLGIRGSVKYILMTKDKSADPVSDMLDKAIKD